MKTKTTAKAKKPSFVPFTVKLSAKDARRLRFIAQEDGITPERLLANSGIKIVEISLEAIAHDLPI